MVSRIALGVEYDGSAFHGWQTQLDPALPTVQECLEAALTQVAAHPVPMIPLKLLQPRDLGLHCGTATDRRSAPEPAEPQAGLVVVQRLPEDRLVAAIGAPR